MALVSFELPVASIISEMSSFNGRKTLSAVDIDEYSASRVLWEMCVCSQLRQIIGQSQNLMMA